MDITSLQRDTGFDTEGIYDLFTSTFFFNTSVALREYKVVLEDERVDLVLKYVWNRK
jgi:hypothetical protein